jgi:transcriptional regulator with XRE-family HTH domain
VKVYKSYNFIDKDPVIDELRTVFKRYGIKYQYVEDRSGVTTQTLRNWFEGKTKRPLNSTVEAVLRAIGGKREIVMLPQRIKNKLIIEDRLVGQANSRRGK